MPETGEGTGQLKQLKRAREQVLKEWDVSFGINGEVFNNIMEFISDISTDIPMKFYKEKIFVNLKSPDNVQYAEIEINASDVLDYKPGLNGDPNRKDAKSIIKGAEGDYKAILIDMRGIMEEMSPFVQKDDIIVIRVDTFYQKRIEFHCPGNVIIWAQLMDPSVVLKNIEKLPEIIRNVRNNTSLKKGSAIIEPATFNRICSIGGKGGKKRDIDERIFIELDKKDGLYITSGDRLKGRIFELKPTEVGGSHAYEERMTEGEMEGMDMGMDMGMSMGMESMEGIDDAQNMEDMNTDDIPGFAPGKNDEDKKKGEKKKSDSKAPIDQLLGMEVDSTQHVYLSKEFIIPFTKLKGLSPIVVEVRTEKPIIIEQRPYNGIRALLSVAPRIESEEDK